MVPHGDRGVARGRDAGGAVDAAVSGFSRIPVYDGSIDHITGIVCVNDTLPFLARANARHDWPR